MVDEVAANRIVSPCFDCDPDLGPNSIGARDQNGLVDPSGNAKHYAKAAEFSDHAMRDGGFHQLPDATLRRCGSIDIDSGASVTKRVVFHAGNSSSNATSRRMSRMR